MQYLKHAYAKLAGQFCGETVVNMYQTLWNCWFFYQNEFEELSTLLNRSDLPQTSRNDRRKKLDKFWPIWQTRQNFTKRENVRLTKLAKFWTIWQLEQRVIPETKVHLSGRHAVAVRHQGDHGHPAARTWYCLEGLHPIHVELEHTRVRFNAVFNACTN